MLRAVLDANVYVSAILRPEGPPRRLLTEFLSSAAFVIVISPEIVDEVLRVLAYPKIRQHRRGDVEPELWFEDIVVPADLVAGARSTARVCADPDDDKHLDAALEGRAACVVTGDRHLLALREYESVQIINPRTFLDLLGAST